MNPSTSNFSIPVDNLSQVMKEHSSIESRLKENNKECGLIKNMMATLLQAAVSPVKPVSKSSALTSPASSLTSIQEISDDDATVVSNGGNSMSSCVPDLEQSELMHLFLKSAAEGKLDLNDEFIQQLYDINSRIDKVNSVASNLQNKWSELDGGLKLLIDDVENLKQYTKKESLLLHNFPLPPSNVVTSLQYSMYVAKQLNTFLPKLPVSLKWEHISTPVYLNKYVPPKKIPWLY